MSELDDDISPLGLTFADIYERLRRIEDALGIDGTTKAGALLDQMLAEEEA